MDLLSEPESVDLHVDGSSDKCSLGQDINFQFKGFGVVGKVTAGFLSLSAISFGF